MSHRDAGATAERCRGLSRRAARCPARCAGRECATLLAVATGLSENFRPADSSESRFGMFPHWPPRGEAVSFEQRFLRESNGFGYRAQWDAPAPALIADKVPRPAFGHVLQNLPDHDARAFERG